MNFSMITANILGVQKFRKFMYMCLTGVRDYIHVVDLAQGHVSALKKIQEKCGCKVCVHFAKIKMRCKMSIGSDVAFLIKGLLTF